MCKPLRHLLLLLLTAATCFPVYAQSSNQETESTSLREQFDAMVRGSNRYQQYRVVPQTELNQFIASVSDTLGARAAELSRLEATIATQTQTITESQAEIASLQNQIKQLEAEKDGIYLLGTLVSKATYNIVLWTLILAAVAGLVFFFLRARLAVANSRSLQQDKEELATALDSAKKRRLEVEQDLRRKLQDEINKRLE